MFDQMPHLYGSKPIVKPPSSRLGFHLLIGLSVVVISFGYGLASGLNRKISKAQATLSYETAPVQLSDKLTLPDGVRVVPLGDEVAINGKPMDVATFISSRGVVELLDEQVKLWERQGLYAAGAASRLRGVAFAVNQATGERFSAVAWVIPPPYRKIISQGEPVEGFVSYANNAAHPAAASVDEASGLIPGVPLAPGGKSGAVLSSRDPGGRSYTGVYSNPGTVQMNVDYYRSVFSADGWRETPSVVGDARGERSAALTFVRNKQEAVLLLSAADGGSSGSDGSQFRTSLTITLGGVTHEISR